MKNISTLNQKQIAKVVVHVRFKCTLMMNVLMMKQVIKMGINSATMICHKKNWKEKQEDHVKNMNNYTSVVLVLMIKSAPNSWLANMTAAMVVGCLSRIVYGDVAINQMAKKRIKEDLAKRITFTNLVMKKNQMMVVCVLKSMVLVVKEMMICIPWTTKISANMICPKMKC